MLDYVIHKWNKLSPEEQGFFKMLLIASIFYVLGCVTMFYSVESDE